MCTEKDVSPWGYLSAFIAGFLVIMGVGYASCLFFYGPNVIHDPEAQKKIESIAPFAMMFQFLLFVYVRRRIERIPDYQDDDDDNNFPPDNGGKKDLSYFR